MTFAGAGTAVADTCHYPPGQCMIGFNHGTYFPPTTANFHAGGHPFHPHSHVTGFLRCARGYHKSVGPFSVNRHGNVNGSFHVGGRQHRGCTLTLANHRGTKTASGSYRVRHHHRGSAAASGSSTGGGSVQNSAATGRSASSNGATVLGMSTTRSVQGGGLPFTGSNDIAPMTGIGAGLIALGGALLLAIRRRRHAANAG